MSCFPKTGLLPFRCLRLRPRIWYPEVKDHPSSLMLVLSSLLTLWQSYCSILTCADCLHCYLNRADCCSSASWVLSPTPEGPAATLHAPSFCRCDSYLCNIQKMTVWNKYFRNALKLQIFLRSLNTIVLLQFLAFYISIIKNRNFRFFPEIYICNYVESHAVTKIAEKLVSRIKFNIIRWEKWTDVSVYEDVKRTFSGNALQLQPKLPADY